jgi:hypothetical protein
MLVTTAWIAKNYEKFNKQFFDNKLPNNIKFKINRSKKSWGFAAYKFDWVNDTIKPYSITISNYYDSPEKVKIQTLLHEMIHIADYTFHPEHFIKNGRKVSAWRYNAHGWWFNEQAKRISDNSDYLITNHVTKEEQEASTLSNRSMGLLANKKSNALICGVIGRNGVWWFKTDVDKAPYLKRTLPKAYNWDMTIGPLKSIKFYTFENDELAARRSCMRRVSGWRLSRPEFTQLLMKYKATEVRY